MHLIEYSILSPCGVYYKESRCFWTSPNIRHISWFSRMWFQNIWVAGARVKVDFPFRPMSLTVLSPPPLPSSRICLSNLWEMELSGQILVKAYQTINLAADPSPAATNQLKSHLPQEKEALRRTWKTLIKTSRPISVIPIRPIVKPLQVRIQSPKFEIYCTKVWVQILMLSNFIFHLLWAWRWEIKRGSPFVCSPWSVSFDLITLT